MTAPAPSATLPASRGLGAGRAIGPASHFPNSLAIFVWADADSAELTATSHFEKLQQSRCKNASGDRLWCGTCHDPHEAPQAAQAAAYFREKCLTCHTPETC